MNTPDTMDPDFAAVGQLLAAEGLRAPSMLTAPIAEVRAMQDRIGTFMARGSVPLRSERDVSLPLAQGRSVRATLYRPDGAALAPVLVYMHGGGFSQGTPPTWAPLARRVVRESGAAVLSLDYSLAPESPFPRALEEVTGAVRALPLLAAELGLDVDRVALGGDSAGANLALAAAMTLRDEGLASLRFLLLFYGVYSSDLTSASWQELGQGQYGLSVQTMRRIWLNYTGQEVPAGDWRVTPLEGDFRGLPPAWACVGTLDPLRDDNHQLQQRMHDAGGSCALRICSGLPHAFVRHVARVPAVDAAIDEGARALATAFA